MEVIKIKYIITGHLGLIGSALKQKLDKLGKCVLAIDRNVENESQIEKNCSTVIIDFRFNTKADILFHLADNCKINKCIKEPELAFENARGIEATLEMCRKNKIKKIVYFSSSRVLSDEKNPYTAAKLYGENLVKAYSKCYGIKYIIIRPSTVYGGPDKTNRLINIWLNRAKRGKDLEIYGPDNKTLSFTYISDFVHAIENALIKDKWNVKYNIAGPTEYLYDVATEIIKQTNNKSKIVFKPEELEQPQSVKVKSDFKCMTNIKHGIKYELERK